MKNYFSWFPKNPLGFCLSHLLLVWVITECVKMIRGII